MKWIVFILHIPFYCMIFIVVLMFCIKTFVLEIVEMVDRK